MASSLAGLRRSAARQAGVLRIALPPFVGGKLIGLLVPMLTAWVRSPGVGVPSGSALLQPFALWTAPPTPRSRSRATRAVR